MSLARDKGHETRTQMLARRVATLERMERLREDALRDGMRLLSKDEILAEVAKHRGESGR